MKIAFFFLGLGILFGFTLPGNPPAEKATSGSLTYRFANLPSTKGVVRVVIYDKPDQFLSENGWFRADSAYIQPDGSAEVKIAHLPFGKYAAALYLDENQNGLIDRNLVGMPVEAYGFSNDVRAKWSVPGFEKAQFAFQNDTQILAGRVQYWSKQ